MKLKEQTVYIPIEGNFFAESPDFRLTDNSKNISTYCFLEKKENQICLSKEKLIEMLNTFFYSGQEYERDINIAREANNRGFFITIKAKHASDLINQLIDNTKQ